jgi:hypothetical protein
LKGEVIGFHLWENFEEQEEQKEILFLYFMFQKNNKKNNKNKIKVFVNRKPSLFFLRHRKAFSDNLIEKKIDIDIKQFEDITKPIANQSKPNNVFEFINEDQEKYENTINIRAKIYSLILSEVKVEFGLE